jgi:hypothetical protein
MQYIACGFTMVSQLVDARAAMDTGLQLLDSNAVELSVKCRTNFVDSQPRILIRMHHQFQMCFQEICEVV